jgi:hypothetical protein
LYTGPVALMDNCDETIYKHFLNLSVAIHILLHPILASQHTSYAKDLLTYFVQQFAQIYGESEIVYNVHALIHLPEDVNDFGCMDNFSAFPFESFLGALKKLVKKPSSMIHQVVKKVPQLIVQENKFRGLRKKHYLGPLPLGNYNNYDQYEQLYLEKFMISTSKGNNIVKIEYKGDSKIGIVKNILSNTDEVLVIYSVYNQLHSFFDHPIDSSRIGIYKISNPGNQLHALDIKYITGKYVCLPVKKDFVVVPILHT